MLSSKVSSPNPTSSKMSNSVDFRFDVLTRLGEEMSEHLDNYKRERIRLNQEEKLYGISYKEVADLLLDNGGSHEVVEEKLVLKYGEQEYTYFVTSVRRNLSQVVLFKCLMFRFLNCSLDQRD